MVYIVDERGIIEESYQTPDDMTNKRGFVIIVQKLYKWKHLPVAKVLFCDCQRFAELLRNDPTGGTQLIPAYFNQVFLHVIHRIPADQQVSLMSLPGSIS